MKKIRLAIALVGLVCGGFALSACKGSATAGGDTTAVVDTLKKVDTLTAQLAKADSLKKDTVKATAKK